MFLVLVYLISLCISRKEIMDSGTFFYLKKYIIYLHYITYDFMHKCVENCLEFVNVNLPKSNIFYFFVASKHERNCPLTSNNCDKKSMRTQDIIQLDLF